VDFTATSKKAKYPVKMEPKFFFRQGQEVFSSPQLPDRLSGPPSLRSNGYVRLFTQFKEAVA
jgi:hypothetical protein